VESSKQQAAPRRRLDLIRDRRLAKRLSISELGRETGISKGYLSQLEAGHKTHPSLEKLAAIARVLEIPLPDLVERPAGLPDALGAFAADRSLDPADVDMLASIRFAGLPPRTRARWEYIWTAIQTSELIDTQSDVIAESRSLGSRSTGVRGLAADGVPPRSDLLAPSLGETRPHWPRVTDVPRDKWTDRKRPLAEFWPARLDECPREGPYLKVSRQAVFEVATTSGGSADGALSLLVAIYAWSSGRRDPRGISRADWIFASSNPEQVGHRLHEAMETLADRGPVAAYRLLVGNEGNAHAIKGLGPAIFTKFLYFAGGVEAERSAGPLRPLILDHRVAASLSRLVTDGHLAAASPRAHPWPAHWYELYVRLAQRWAEDLGTSPDVVEWLLWDRGVGASDSHRSVPPRPSNPVVQPPTTARTPWAELTIGDEEHAVGPTREGHKKAWTKWDLQQVLSQPRSTRDEQAPIGQGRRG
jgi:transcriptional regulator with XRE-family HTH domain